MSDFNQFRLINAEKLSEAQSRCVERCLSLTKASGVLVGALEGNGPWDMRPLLLERDQLYLLRFSNPELALDKARYQALKELHENLFKTLPPPGTVARGEAAGQLWIKRRYYQSLLSDEAYARSQAIYSRNFVAKLLELFQSLSSYRHIHGHISPNNLALEDGSPVLLDFGFYVTSSTNHASEWSAPEVGKLPINPEIDIYGLGAMLQLIVHGAASGEFSPGADSFARRIVNPDPKSRLTLPEIQSFFAPHTISSSGRRLDVDKQRVRSGKFISAEEKKGRVREDSPQNIQIPAAITTFIEGAKAQPFFVFLALLIALMTGIYFMNASDVETMPLDEYWNSNQESLMRQVAQAAVADSNERARLVIAKDAAKRIGKSGGNIRFSLIRVALDPAWEGQLQATDRDIVYRLALANIFPEGKTAIPPLDKAHPGVLLALASDVDLDRDLGAFGKFPVSLLFSLPDPYGQAYAVLSKQGAVELGDSVVRGLAHIIAKDYSTATFDSYFNGGDQKIKLLVLLPLAVGLNGLEASLEAYWKSNNSLLAERNHWFFTDDVAGWSKLSASTRLRIMGGIAPDKKLTLEQYGDLLTYPDESVRQLAIDTLTQNYFDKNEGNMISFLGSERNQLTRLQTVSLIAGLKFQGAARYSIISKWFEAQPDVNSVVALLVSRIDIVGVDPFNVEAGRYLAARNWNASTKELVLLARHPDNLARALAYTRLDPSKPQERAVLLGASRTERDPKLKQELEERLKSIPMAQEQKNNR